MDVLSASAPVFSQSCQLARRPYLRPGGGLFFSVWIWRGLTVRFPVSCFPTREASANKLCHWLSMFVCATFKPDLHLILFFLGIETVNIR